MAEATLFCYNATMNHWWDYQPPYWVGITICMLAIAICGGIFGLAFYIVAT